MGRTVAARIALSFALRIVPGTGWLAGPFSRAYWYQVLNRSGTAAAFVRGAVETGVAPDWISSVIGSAVDAEICEGSDRRQGLGATTWNAEAGEQSNWPNLRGFVAEVQRGTMRETTLPPVTWKSRGEPRPWGLEYARDQAGWALRWTSCDGDSCADTPRRVTG